MQLQFVSHAGFIITVNGKKIFTDPWTKSKAFNNSWALLSKPIEVGYNTIDYIFITHEHPDHFNLPTLKSIPDIDKKRITILYQEHASPRMINAFVKLGFEKIVELPVYQWTTVDDIQLYCGSVGSIDSFLAVKNNGQTLLNLNDCVLNQKQYQYIYKEVGQVDVLLTQFSFANWVGNDTDQMGAAQKKVNDIHLQLKIFNPKYTIPFASYVYFCNEENARMNAWVNTPEYINHLNIPSIQFMYSGDVINMANPVFASEEAVARYEKDYKSIIIDSTPEQVDLNIIKTSVLQCIETIHGKIPYVFRLMIKPVSIYIHDLNTGIEINFNKQTIAVVDGPLCRYSMCSQVCNYTFQYLWGSGTLQVSGMYKDRLYPAKSSKFFFFQNLISSSYIDFSNLHNVKRTIKFFWRKKWELYYRFI